MIRAVSLMSMLLSAVACGSDANSGNDTTAGGDTSAAGEETTAEPTPLEGLEMLLLINAEKQPSQSP